MAATSPVNAKRRVRLDGGVPAASCSAPLKHDVGGPAERRASHVRARGNRIRRKGGALRRLASAPAARPQQLPSLRPTTRSFPRRKQQHDDAARRGDGSVASHGRRCRTLLSTLVDTTLVRGTGLR
jgi:hypothetical protein